MDPFPLFSLHPILLEKVINKFEVDSYYRFQQTCRDAYSFIQESRNITILFDGIVHLYNKRIYTNPRLFPLYNIGQLYKIRLETFVLSGFQTREDFDTYHKTMKDNQLTAVELEFRCYPCGRDAMQTDEYAQFVDILKPVAVHLASERASMYEAILAKPTVVHFDPNEAELAVPQLLSSFEKVKVCADDDSAVKDTFTWLRGALQSLFSQSRPKLRDFVYEINWGEQATYSRNEFEEKLSDYGFEIFMGELRYGKVLSGTLIVPGNFPIGSNCHVNIYLRRSKKMTSYFNLTYYVEIKYSREEEE